MLTFAQEFDSDSWDSFNLVVPKHTEPSCQGLEDVVARVRPAPQEAESV